ncbi:hypothetical protein APSETT444_005500 [Aspergillus pseudonomiae]
MEANGIPRAFVRGPTEPPIYSKTFGQLLDEQAAIHDKRPAILSPWQGINLSYDELAQRSKHVSKALLGMGLAYGDCVGIMAGNSCQHIEVLMGGARIGCPVVSLHSTYTPEELKRAVRKTTCKLLFIASHIGRRDLSAHVEMAKDWLSSGALPNLRGVLTIGQSDYDGYVQGLHTYETLFSEYKEGVTAPDVDATFLLDLAEKAVTPDDVVRFEFTSVGLLASLTHGSAIVLPSDHFSAHAVLEAIKKQAPTVLLGVPTMFVAELDAMAKGQADTSLRAAVVGGSPMPSALTKNICDLMKIKEVHVVYGMMEAGVMFMGSFNGLEESTGMVGHVMPHVSAKVLNRSGEVASRGEKGELYTSGYSLQKGYFDDEEKTAEAMTRDKDGHIWMRTGDEAIIDENGCCYITGRIKDIIIRGGENISPWEVESRLASHPSISEASVFGLPDTKYGEVVGCFLKCALDSERLSNEEVQGWVDL